MTVRNVHLISRHSVKALAVFLVLLVAGCGGSTSKTKNQNTTGQPLTKITPPAKGQLASATWALPFGEPPSLDYIQNGYFSQGAVLANLCDQLFWTNPTTGKAVPNIATSMSEPDPLTVVLNIRHGIKFWDGHELTASDVANSLQRNDDPKLGAVGVAYFSSVKSIVATSPYRVTISLTKPDELFPKELAGAPAGMVAEASYVKQKGSAYGTPSGGVMCSGPFELSKWTPGESIVITRNPNYWNKALEPKVQKLTFLFTSDSSSLTSGLLSGHVDGAYEVPATSIPVLQHATSGHLYFGQSSEFWSLNPFKGVLSDPKLRTALSLAIDRESIVKSVFYGAGQPLKSLVPPWSWGYARNVFAPAYAALPGGTQQIAKAKALVAAAGASSKPITIGIEAGNQLQLQMGTIIQAAAKTVGLQLRLRALTPTQYVNLYVAQSARNGLAGALLSGFYVAQDPLDELPYTALPNALGGYINFIDYKNSQLIHEVEEARTTADPTQRARLLVAAQKLITAANVMIPLVSQDEVTFVRNGLTGIPVQWGYMYYPWAALLGAS